MTADASELLVEGPWRHRFVAANGARLHVAELGEGPLVLLLHGFPQFWWAWRDQLVALAEGGYRAVAMDLRGYGASDKSPRGYDTASLAADVSGVIRALGESSAVIVGHDWGGWLAWSMPVYARRLTRGIATVSMAHPLALRPALQRSRFGRERLGRGGSALDDGSPAAKKRGPVAQAATEAVGAAADHAAEFARQTRALRDVLAFQVPALPERALSRGDGVARILTRWGGPGYPEPAVLARYTRAMQVPFVAHTSLEYFRWALRSLPRSDGRRFASALEQPVDVPVLQLHGGLDPYVLRPAVEASAAWVRGSYESVVFPAAGHFLPEEEPHGVSQALLDWLACLPPARSTTR